MSVRFEIKNYKALKKQIEDVKKAPPKVMRAITSDAQKRVPGWIATEVTKVYGVKKAEISSKKIGTVNVQGNSIDQVKVVYKGRVLTPTHFSMSPKAPKPNRGSYTLKATILSGNRVTMGQVKKLTKKQRAEMGKNFTRSGSRNSTSSPIMLMPTGSTYIPFQRVSANRKDVVAIKTLSLPQMVSSERTKDNIQHAIDEGLSKRLEHHMNRFMKK